METAAPAVDVGSRIDPGGEEDVDPPPLPIEPETVACETGVADRRGRESRPGAPAQGPPPPPQGVRPPAGQGGCDPYGFQQSPWSQPFRGERLEIARPAEQPGMRDERAESRDTQKEPGIAVLGSADGRRRQRLDGKPLLRREVRLLARVHRAPRDVRAVAGRRLDRLEPERIEDAR